MFKHVIGLVLFAMCFGAGWLSSYRPKPDVTRVYQSNLPFPEPGSGSGYARGDHGRDRLEDLWATPPARNPNTTGLKILAKPRAQYRSEARDANIEGTVLLRVTFLANGEIGGVTVIKPLTPDLTEQAVDAAKQIRFEAARVNGVPQTVTKSVEYSFSLY